MTPLMSMLANIKDNLCNKDFKFYSLNKQISSNSKLPNNNTQEETANNQKEEK